MTNAFAPVAHFAGTTSFGINDLVLNAEMDLHIQLTLRNPTQA
jgi:hypothetical protein